MMMTERAPARPPTNEGSGRARESVAAPPVSGAALRRGMSALVRKEVRENWPYALLCWLLWAALAIVLLQFATEDLHKGINILASGLLEFPTAISAGAFGLWIGIGSTVRQRDPDQWALFVHRPFSRSQLFLGRIVGGTLLYILAMGVPCIVLVIVAATPADGQFFEWHMTLPTLADFIAGYLCYLIGFLVGDRSAFLLGSRGLPILLAIALFYADFLIPRFSWFLALAAVAAALLLLANWGSTLSRGYRLERATPLAARWSLRILLALAFLPIVALATLPFWTTLNHRENPFPAYTLGTIRSTRTFYRLSPDGTILKVLWTYENGHATVSSPTDLDGNPVPRPSTSQPAIQTWSLSAITWSWPTNYRDLADQITTYSAALDATNQPHEIWYFVHPAGLAYGYDAKTHAFLGTIGQSGFAPPGSPRPTPFERDEVNRLPFIYPNGIFQVDFDHHTVTPLWQAAPAERLLTIAGNPVPPVRFTRTPAAQPASDFWQALITTKAIHIYDPFSHSVIVTLPLQQTLTTGSELIQLADNHGWATRSTGDARFLSHSYEEPETFTLYDSAGHFLWSRTLVATGGFTPDKISPSSLHWLQWDQCQRGLLTSVTLPAAGLVPQVRDIILSRAPDDRIRSLLTPWLNAGLLTGALVSALLTLPLTVIYRTRWKAAWILAAFLLGPAIPLTLLATQSLPSPRPGPAPKPTASTIIASGRSAEC